MSATPSKKPLLFRLIQVLGFLLLLGLMLFGSAGRIDWPGAWVFIILYLAFVVFFYLWFSHSDPDLIQERSQVAENTKAWDKTLMSIYTVFLAGIPIIAGLDFRFGWAQLSRVWLFIGVAILALAGALIFWAAMTNTYLSRYVRIQSDRGHQVVTTGPYHIVRHPMYGGIILFAFSVALILGSAWSLLASTCVAVLIVLRTAIEDRTLQKELPGYQEYTRQTPFRLIPGIW